VLVPRSHLQALDIDKNNGNTKWQDAEATKMRQLLEYQTFVDKGKGDESPIRYRRIRCHMIYDIKHDRKHKSRIVAGGQTVLEYKNAAMTLLVLNLSTFSTSKDHLLLSSYGHVLNVCFYLSNL
jgi:hypothetical protein